MEQQGGMSDACQMMLNPPYAVEEVIVVALFVGDHPSRSLYHLICRITMSQQGLLPQDRESDCMRSSTVLERLARKHPLAVGSGGVGR